METRQLIDLNTEDGVLRLRIEIAKTLGYEVINFNHNPFGIFLKTPSTWILLKPGQSRDWTIIREYLPRSSEMYATEKKAWQATPNWTGDMEIAFTLPLGMEEFFALHGPCDSEGYVENRDETFYAFVYYRWPDDDPSEHGTRASAHALSGAVALSAAWLRRTRLVGRWRFRRLGFSARSGGWPTGISLGCNLCRHTNQANLSAARP